MKCQLCKSSRGRGARHSYRQSCVLAIAKSGMPLSICDSPELFPSLLRTSRSAWCETWLFPVPERSIAWQLLSDSLRIVSQRLRSLQMRDGHYSPHAAWCRPWRLELHLHSLQCAVLAVIHDQAENLEAGKQFIMMLAVRDYRLR